LGGSVPQVKIFLNKIYPHLPSGAIGGTPGIGLTVTKSTGGVAIARPQTANKIIATFIFINQQWKRFSEN